MYYLFPHYLNRRIYIYLWRVACIFFSESGILLRITTATSSWMRVKHSHDACLPVNTNAAAVGRCPPGKTIPRTSSSLLHLRRPRRPFCKATTLYLTWRERGDYTKLPLTPRSTIILFTYHSLYLPPFYSLNQSLRAEKAIFVNRRILFPLFSFISNNIELQI